MSRFGVGLVSAAGLAAIPYMKEVIDFYGFAANAEVILDAADIASYGGSGQSFVDRSSNASVFNLGSTSGSETSDPTFNGSAGVRSSAQYFGADGGDYFTVSANTAFLGGLHKSGSKFTAAMWVWNGGSAGSNSLLGCNSGTTAQHGHAVYFSSGKYLIMFTRGDSVTAYSVATGANALTGQWAFVAYSFDQTTASNNLLFNQNGTQETLSLNVSAPSATNASVAMQMLALGGGGNIAANGSRLAAFSMFNRALSHAEIAQIFSATRGRFGV